MTTKFFFAALLHFSIASQAQDSQIVSVSPTGAVKKIRQVVVKFNQDMIALGDPRSHKNPGEVQCKPSLPKHHLKWADTKTWTINFDQELPGSIDCTLTMKDDLKDLKDQSVKTQRTYYFGTSGPSIVERASFWQGIVPDQHFLFLLDSPADPGSIERIAYFEVEGQPSKWPVRIVTGSVRNQIIQAAIENYPFRQYSKFVKGPADIDTRPEFKNFLVVKSGRIFPEATRVSFHWPVGISSTSGIPTQDAQNFEFSVVDKFEARFSCDRANADLPCNPITDLSLYFTRAIPNSVAQQIRLVKDAKTQWPPKKSSTEDSVNSVQFTGPFPESSNFKVVLPPGIKDDLDRSLSNQNKFPLTIRTDEYSPLLKFAANFGVIEAKTEALLPVSVRNVEKQLPTAQFSYEGKSIALTSASHPAEIIGWLKKIRDKDWDYSRRGVSLLQDVRSNKIQFQKPSGSRDFEIVGIPLKSKGFHIVEMESPKLGQYLLSSPGTMYVAASALVTNMSVHFKKGREASVIWVTELDSAKAVSEAQVYIVDSDGKQLAKASTDKSGIARFGEIDYPCGFQFEGEVEDGPQTCEVFAFAKKGDDFSFASSQWSQGIEEYRFNLQREYLAQRWGPAVAHTILDRALMQKGELIRMKHVMRNYGIKGFSALNPKVLPKRVTITHSGSGKSWDFPFVFDSETGTALTEFQLPKTAELGLYTVTLSNKDKVNRSEDGDDSAYDWYAKTTATFLVSEYRLPVMSATVKIREKKLVNPASVSVDLSANYLSGGPAADLPVKVRAQIVDAQFSPEIPGAAEFNFFSLPKKAGVIDADQPQNDENRELMKVVDLKLSKMGGQKFTWKALPGFKKLGQLNVEMEYKDPNGEVRTASHSQVIYPADYVVGLKSETWMAVPGKVAVQGIVATSEGKALSNIKYQVFAFKEEYVSHRKKIVGGFYSYDNKTVITGLGLVCEGLSDKYGRFKCLADKLGAGRFTLEAQVSDKKGRSTYAHASMSVYALGNESWWTPSDSDRIDLIPEKVSYEPGEKAQIVVKSPFPVSTVLITVEREGVIDSFVKEISRDNPVIDLPIKDGYAPNIFVSAVAIRGRVADPKPTALVDLAKPALKLGMAEIRVGWRAHELKVEVIPNKKRFQTREVVEVTVKVKSADGSPLAKNSEVALAAVDESLLSLRSNESWNLLYAMMGQRGLAVDTSSSQLQVIGKRHFGLKARPHGGGGGAMASEVRQLFDAILLWQPRLKLNANGEATIKVPLNDSLTQFHIEAVATSGMNHFGRGSTKVQATKDLILYSGFAPLVRIGDQLKNTVTVRNTTDKELTVNFELSSAQIKELPRLESVILKASESKIISVPVQIPLVVGDYEFLLKANAGTISDQLLVKVKAAPSLQSAVLMSTLLQLDSNKTEKIPVKQPADNLAGSGGLEVQASSSLSVGLSEVQNYMQDYPYSCLEQQISKATVLQKQKDLQTINNDLPSYQDQDGLFKFFPSSSCGDIALSRYVLRVLNKQKVNLSDSVKANLQQGFSRFVKGQITCHRWYSSFEDSKFTDQRKVLALHGLAILGALDEKDFASLPKTLNLWSTEAVLALAHILEMYPKLAGADKLSQEVQNTLLTRVNYQGSLMNLQGQLDYMSEWMLFTNPDVEAIGVFSQALGNPAWAADVGKMARGVMARLKRGTWETTTANALGWLAFQDFKAKYENQAVKGSTEFALAGKVQKLQWQDKANGQVQMGWPEDSKTQQHQLQMQHKGSGKPWMLVQAKAAIPLKAPLNLGYVVSKKWEAITRKNPKVWSVGDVIDVRLTVKASTDQAWVVVNDPIPAGATILGSGLAGQSQILDRSSEEEESTYDDGRWPADFDERSMTSFISYANYVRAGEYNLSYRLRLNSAGEMMMPNTRVEAMYAPEVFGEIPNANWLVND